MNRQMDRKKPICWYSLMSLKFSCYNRYINSGCYKRIEKNYNIMYFNGHCINLQRYVSESTVEFLKFYYYLRWLLESLNSHVYKLTVNLAA